jgi:hypothetical protein
LSITITHRAPAGRPPAAVVTADDLVLDIQCLADDQATNTGALLAYMDEADDDGHIDDREWGYICRHVRLEHRWNTEMIGRSQLLRRCLNGLCGLVADLRVQVHQMRRAARESGS